MCGRGQLAKYERCVCCVDGGCPPQKVCPALGPAAATLVWAEPRLSFVLSYGGKAWLLKLFPSGLTWDWGLDLLFLVG